MDQNIFPQKDSKIPAKKCSKCFSGASRIDLWNSNGISEENIKNATKPSCNFAATFVNHHLL